MDMATAGRSRPVAGVTVVAKWRRYSTGCTACRRFCHPAGWQSLMKAVSVQTDQRVVGGLSAVTFTLELPVKEFCKVLNAETKISRCARCWFSSFLQRLWGGSDVDEQTVVLQLRREKCAFDELAMRTPARSTRVIGCCLRLI